MIPRAEKLFLIAVLYNVKVNDICLPGVERLIEEFRDRLQLFLSDKQNM